MDKVIPCWMKECQIKYLLLVVILCTACSEKVDAPQGKTTGLDTDRPEPSTVLTEYLPFVARSLVNEVNTATAYRFVDINDMKNRTLNFIAHIDGVATKIPATFYSGNFSESQFAVQSHRLDTFVYEKNDKLYKIDVRDVFVPETRRFSSESNAKAICTIWDIWAEDYSVPENSRYIYYLAKDYDLKNCEEFGGEWRMITLADNNLDSPVTLPSSINYFVTSLYDKTNGAVSGWLVIDTLDRLVRYSIDFDQSKIIRENVFASSGADAIFLTQNSSKEYIISLGGEFVWYDDSSSVQAITKSMSGYSDSAANSIFLWRNDGATLYYIVDENQSTSTSTLLRVNLDGNTNPDVLPLNEKILKMEVSTSTVLLATDSALLSVSLNSFNQAISLSIPTGLKLGLDEMLLGVMYAVDGFLFVELMDNDIANLRSVWVINETLGKNEFLTDFYIAGVTYQSDLPFVGDRKIRSLLLESGRYNDATKKLFSLKPENYPILLELGDLPVRSDTSLIVRSKTLGRQTGVFSGLTGRFIDIFSFDADSQESVFRLTETKTNETVFDF